MHRTTTKSEKVNNPIKYDESTAPRTQYPENDILTIKVGRDSQDLHGFLLLHAAFLDEVVLAFENIVRPTVGGLGNELKLFFPVQTRKE